MSLFRNVYAIVLLVLTLKQNLTLASFANEKNKMETLARAIISSMEVPWIDGIHPFMHSPKTPCIEEIAAISAAFMARETWALQLLDASSKIPSGILKGNVQDLGMYDECVEANGRYNNITVHGEYCMVSFSILSLAVCVPSSCNETQVLEIGNAMIQQVPIIHELGLGINRVSCVQVGSEDFTTGEILTILFFSAVAAFMVFCTICEFIKTRSITHVSPVVNELAKFSLYTNAKTVMSTKASPRMMPAIQGIRFLSICWIVLAHRQGISFLKPTINFMDAFEWYGSWHALHIQVAPFAVDTFFVISGFLAAYLFFTLDQSGKILNIPKMYLHRYLRLTPCLAVLMLFVAVLLHRVSNGPVWEMILTAYVEPCRKNWWVNLLYIQNFVSVEEPCLVHTWYLAVDMQLFWISPFILYPLYRWPKWGHGILGLALIISVVTPAVVLAVNGFSNAGSVGITENDIYYFKPTYNRACPYFVGIAVGYAAVTWKKRLSLVIVVVNWMMAFIFMLLCGLAMNHIHDTKYEYDVVLETVFAVWLRPFWSIAMAWIIYACSFGYGGPVTRFLSLPIFLPLSRLSYGIYLVHMVLQSIITCMAQTPGRFTGSFMPNDYWSDLVFSIGISFLFSLFIESPVIVFERLITNHGRKSNPVPVSKSDVTDRIDNERTMTS